MRTIEVDDEVWREMQKKAEPLVDTPNSVLRRLLGIEEGRRQGAGRSRADGVLGITLRDLHSPHSFALIPLPRQHRTFFPGYKVDFYLETDVGLIQTRVTSAPKGTLKGDPTAGSYIQGGLRPWYDNRKDLQPGDTLRFETIVPGQRYKLSVVHAKSLEPDAR